MATRHLLRLIVVQSLFEWFFNERKENLKDIFERNLKNFASDVQDPEFGYRLVEGIENKLPEIESRIMKYAHSQWPIEEIPLINLSILRLGIYELLFSDPKEVPPKVAINEAVELASILSNEEAVKFINGVLASVYKEKYGTESNPL